MIKVNTSTLKAQLSKYLHIVRAGKKVVVTDRSTPIAYLIPVPEGAQSSPRLQMVRASDKLSKLNLRGIPYRGTDTVAELRMDRDAR